MNFLNAVSTELAKSTDYRTDIYKTNPRDDANVVIYDCVASKDPDWILRNRSHNGPENFIRSNDEEWINSRD